MVASVCVLCYERCLFLRELFLLFFYFIHDLNFASENLFFFIYPITIIYVNVMLRVYVFFLVSGGT